MAQAWPVRCDPSIPQDISFAAGRPLLRILTLLQALNKLHDGTAQLNELTDLDIEAEGE